MEISVSEACKLTGLTQSAIQKWISDKKLLKVSKKNNQNILNKREVLLQQPTVISLFNRKGGVGKTTVSSILADYYHAKDLNILLLDLDPQENLSKTFLDYDALEHNLTFYDFMQRNTPITKLIHKVNEHIDLIRSSEDMGDLIGVDLTYWDNKKDSLRTLFKKYQIIIIDCPPALDAFSRLGLVLANYILIPLIPEPYSADGFIKAVNTVKQMSDHNRGLIDFRTFISKHELRRAVIREEVETDLREALAEKMLKNAVPNFVGLVERYETKENIFSMYKNGKQIENLQNFCDEIDNFLFEERESD